MATRKDQLDAFNFARRRMVANLVVPTATGSDEGAPRPVKTFASSLILSAIAVAAVAVLGVFKPSAPSGWQGGLAVDSSSGAAYIDQSNELHAVYNITSARLILGQKFQKFDVPDATLHGSGIPIGSSVGILGAPEDVPAAANMTLAQWSLCQNEKSASDEGLPGGQTYLEIGYWPSPSSVNGMFTSTSNMAFVVHDTAENVYLIDGNYKYLVGNDNADRSTVQGLLKGIFNNSFVSTDLTGYWVSDAWLSAFPNGSRIDFPTLSDLGATPENPSSQLGRVGQYGTLDSGAGVVQTKTGVVELSPFAYNLYVANQDLATHHVSPLPSSVLHQSAVTAANASGGAPDPASVFVNGDGENTYGANWPTNVPALRGTDTSDPTAQNVCVGFSSQQPGGGTELTTWISAQLPYGSPGGHFGLTQTSSTDYANTVLVKPGYGLLAQGSNGGSAASGDVYLIEDSGFRYALRSDTLPGSGSGSGSSNQSVSAVQQLGYQGLKTQTVPNGFLDLIPSGTPLSPVAAGYTPGNG